MGCIIAPLFLMWVIGAGYSIYLFNAMFSEGASGEYVLTALAVGSLLGLVYARVGLSRFKDQVYVFDIPFFFLLNKYAISVFVLAVIYRCWGDSLLQHSHNTAVGFALTFAMSAGTLLGIFCAGAYVRKRDIHITH
jgi:hypothetical protein